MPGDRISKKEYILTPLLTGIAAGLFMLMCSCTVSDSLPFCVISAVCTMAAVLVCGCICGRLSAFLPAAFMLCTDIILKDRFLAEAVSAADETAYRFAVRTGELFFASADTYTPPILLTMTVCALLCAVCTAFGQQASCVLFAAGAAACCTAFGASLPACGLIAVCVCVILTGRKASAPKGIVITALTAAAVMTSAFVYEKYSAERIPHFSGEVSAPQGQPLYLRHKITEGEELTKSKYTACSEYVYKLAENGFAPQFQANYLIKAADTSETTGEVVLPKDCGLSPVCAVSAEGMPLRRVDGTGFEKGTCRYTVSPLMYRDVFLLTDKLDTEKSRDYLRCEALCREYVYSCYSGISRSDSELISKYISVDLTAPQYKKLETVRDFISKQISPSPESKDFTLAEMLEKKSADDDGIAHLSVMLLRNSGLAAREVRGCYFGMIPQSGKADLSDSQYRTWAEVYIDGAGWIPFEAAGEYALPLPALPEKTGSEDTSASPLPETGEDITVTQPKLVQAKELPDEDVPLQMPDIRLLAILPAMLALWCLTVFVIRLMKKRRIYSTDNAVSVKAAHFEALHILSGTALISSYLPEDITPQLEKELGKNVAEKYRQSRRAYEKLLYSKSGAEPSDTEKARAFYMQALACRKNNTPLPKRILQTLFTV